MAVSAPSTLGTPEPIAADDLTHASAQPEWLINSDCVYRLHVIVQGEALVLHDQAAYNFVAAQVLKTATFSQCSHSPNTAGYLEGVWNGWKNVKTGERITDEIKAAVKWAMANPNVYPACQFVGSSDDVIGVWVPQSIKFKTELSVDYIFPSADHQRAEYGLNCHRGK